MTTKHTPTPYNIRQGSNIIIEAINPLSGFKIAIAHVNPEEAAFIVHACNSHEKLCKAVKKVARILDAQDDPRYAIHHPLVKPLLEALSTVGGDQHAKI